MHRIDADGHVANAFADADPGVPTQGTMVDDDWLNAVQENICEAIEAASITLVKGDHTQLTDAVQVLSVAAVAAATNTFAQLLTLQKGAVITQSTANTAGLTVTGNGSGNGGTFTAGATGHGVSGLSSGNAKYGVRGENIGGDALAHGVTGFGNVAGSAGVSGTSQGGDGNGIQGFASGVGVGAYGSGDSGPGVMGVSTTGYGGQFSGNATRGNLHLTPQSQPSSGTIGDIYMTTAGVLKVCTATGTPGTWVSVGTQT